MATRSEVIRDEPNCFRLEATKKVAVEVASSGRGSGSEW